MIRPSQHAREALEQRDIAFEWAERTLAAPDFAHPDPSNPFRSGCETMMRTSYDPETDAMFVRFSPDCVKSAETEEAASGIMLDFDDRSEDGLPATARNEHATQATLLIWSLDVVQAARALEARAGHDR